VRPRVQIPAGTEPAQEVERNNEIDDDDLRKPASPGRPRVATLCRCGPAANRAL